MRKAGVSVQCHSGDQERVKKKEEQWNTVHMIAHKRSLHTQILTRSNGMNFKLQREFQTSNMHELTRHKSKIKKILKKKRKRKYDCRPYKYKTCINLSHKGNIQGNSFSLHVQKNFTVHHPIKNKIKKHTITSPFHSAFNNISR